jgi:hypothetical protein
VELNIAKRTSPETFDKAYYDRYYRNPSTRAASPASCKRQAAFIAAYLRHLEIPITSIVDVGCGTGMLLRALSRHYSKAQAEGFEFSQYLCSRYGWNQGSVTEFSTDAPVDLLICNDVLGYLSDSDCQQALEKLSSACGYALYLGVLTTEDLALCDPERTDSAQIDRPVHWYRKRLQKHFINAGGGLWLKKPLEVILWSLEHL